MQAEIHKEHRWLQKLIGEWKFKSASEPRPGEEACDPEGSESVRAIGDLWIMAEGWGTMPGGGEARMVLTLGYDPQKGRFVGTWIGSMMTFLWVYEGHLDDSGRVLTLETTGPKMTPKGPSAEGTASYREVIELESDDVRTFTSLAQGDDGKWVQIMKATYRRVR